MRLHRRTLLIASTVGALALAAPAAAAAPPTARPGWDPVVVADGLVSPLSFEVTSRGDVYVAQSFAGLLTRVARDGTREDVVVAEPGTSVGAVSLSRGTLTWSERVGDEETFEVTSAVLVRRAKDGTEQRIDLLAYEESANPDSVNTYGIQGLSEECAATLPPDLAPVLLPYEGQVDSNPYASVTSRGTTYVADAGANAIFAVAADGSVTTAAVLPPVVIDLTAEAVDALELDECLIGLEYWAEPVPTDVEAGPRGALYVTSLPGGPEDDSLGANGSLWRLAPRSGELTLVHRGFLGATDLAVAPNGTVYVTELFGGRVSAVGRGASVRTVAELEQPAAAEWAKGRLYVSTQVFGNGTIVSLLPRMTPPRS